MSEPEILLEGSAIDLGLGGRQVLSGVNIRLPAGRIVALIGPNGAGKSTLLRVLLGLLRPERGRVWRRPGIRIGYMPQRVHIEAVLPLTVARFLTLGGRASREQTDRALEYAGAAHLVESPVQAVSGGEMQRVLLARALMHAPQLLMLDEPVQGVDVSGQQEFYELIGRIRAEMGCGVLMVSHDLHLVMAATDHVVCLNRHVCCDGHPEAVTRHPEYLQLFGEQGSRGLAVYAHAHDHGHDPSGAVVEARAREKRRRHHG